MAVSVPELHAFPTHRTAIFILRSTFESMMSAPAALGDEDLETGGHLLGRLIEPGRVQIEDFLHDRNADRSPWSVSLTFAADHRRSQELGLNLIGTWHTHPLPGDSDARSAPTDPSRVDRVSAISAMDALGADVFVDLILVYRSYGGPDVTAWVTRRDERGQAVTEAATLCVPDRYF